MLVEWFFEDTRMRKSVGTGKGVIVKRSGGKDIVWLQNVR
jgi:hypothetical protein